MAIKKAFRVKCSQDFDNIFKAKNSFANRAFIIYQLKRDDASPDKPHYRVGISVSKRLGKAHTRVHIKRLIRHAVRSYDSYLQAVDFVVIARPGVEKMDYQTVSSNLLHALKKSNIYVKEK